MISNLVAFALCAAIFGSAKALSPVPPCPPPGSNDTDSSCGGIMPPAATKNPCALANDNATDAPPGSFVPSCTANGWYDAVQCSGSTGYCWCVYPDSGLELEGTKIPPGSNQNLTCPKCLLEQANSLPEIGIVGAYVPQCDSLGNYEPQQFHGSTGYTWCVNPITGEKINGTDTPPGKNSPDCAPAETRSLQGPTGPINGGGGSAPVVLGTSPVRPTKNPCDLNVDKYKGKKLPQDFTFPTCTKNGWYDYKQCNGMTGYCWCAFPQTGSDLAGTGVAPGGNLACPPCLVQQAKALPPVKQTGAYVPQCDSKGNFEVLQFGGSTGYTWCVDPISGVKIAGTDTPPGKGPLNCKRSQPKNACQKALDSLPKPPPPGAFTPSCTSSGWYNAKQCHASTGSCFCVFPSTGKEVAGTRTRGSNVSCPACLIQQAKALLAVPRPGSFVPQCDSKGNFNQIQSNPSTGYSYCVNTVTGAKISGTDTPPGRNLFSCEADS